MGLLGCCIVGLLDYDDRQYDGSFVGEVSVGV